VDTTNAIDKGLAPGGFLARNLEDAKKMIGSTTDPLHRDEVQIFITPMEQQKDLRPDVILAHSEPMPLAGRPVDVHVTDKAVSDADVWLFDKATRVAVIGDLVTMPVPYFETACPDKWRDALDEVWATPFETAVPGHGRPMTRPQLDTYRQALTSFVSCVRTDKPSAECAAAWVDGAGSLIGDDADRRKAVAANMEYYVGYLRKGGGKAPECMAK